MWVNKEADKGADIGDLFWYLKHGQLDLLRKGLNENNVNTSKVVLGGMPDYTGYRKSYHYVVKTHALLLFHAMAIQSYGGFKIILESGANLFSKEYSERTDYDESSGRLQSSRKVKESDTALVCITNSEDPQFIQITFDHICARGLYKNSDYVDFLVDHLDKVKLDKFKPEYLMIDVGNDMPTRFETTEQYKEFLVGLGIDISGFFFYPSEYFDFLTNPSNNIEGALLARALNICRFTSEQIKIIYDSLPTEELKKIVEDHAPDVNPDFLAQIGQICDEAQLAAVEASAKKEAQSKKRALEHPGNSGEEPKSEEITNLDRQQYTILKDRIALLNRTIPKLEEEEASKLSKTKSKKKINNEEKPGQKLKTRSLKTIRAELASKRANLIESEQRFFSNPVYRAEKKAKLVDPKVNDSKEEVLEGSHSI